MGLEAALVPAGGRLLGGLAGPAAKKLARKWTFRWRVCRRVRRKVDFTCSWSDYRRWLKTLTADELGEPVEDVIVPLAERLDQFLSDTPKTWASVDGHLSRAIRLVELTYPAIAAALDHADRTDATESWAQRRNARDRRFLLDHIGSAAALSSEDLSAALEQRSSARRAVRLQAFEVCEDDLTEYFDRIEIPEIPDGAVAVLLGEFGSGKSETAEAWHRARIKDLTARNEAPFPVWVNARDVFGTTLESSIDRALGPTWRRRGASVVVDGLDEIDSAMANALLDDARVLARSQACIKILLTARKGIVSPTDAETITVALLADNEARNLIELASREKQQGRLWNSTPGMRETLARPFFALATGLLLSQGKTLRREADMIRELVEHALTRGPERSALTSDQTRSVLQRLAVSLTTNDKDGLSFNDRLTAGSSRLAASAPDGQVRFALPIFQQWFAAQAILAGDVPASNVMANARMFSRWRWAGAVAALSAQTEEQLDHLLTSWVKENPGAASWTMTNAFGRSKYRPADDLQPTVSGERLLQAIRTWERALGPLANDALPSPLIQGAVGLGVGVLGQNFCVAFSKSRFDADSVIEIPPRTHPLHRHPDWQLWISGRVPKGNAWPWTVVLERIADSMSTKLEDDPFLGSPDGIWTQEYRYYLSRQILGKGRHFLEPLPTDEVRSRASEMLDRIEWRPNSWISRNSLRTSGAELANLVSWIDEAAPYQVSSHLPDADVPKSQGKWAWDAYSPQRLMMFEAEVYGRACEAYDEALMHSFAQLGWSMSNFALSPFGLVLTLDYHGDTPGLKAIQVPMDLMPEVAPSGPDSIWAECGRAVITQTSQSQADSEWEQVSIISKRVNSWLTERHREPIGGFGWMHTGADDMATVRPASSRAAQWIWQDLKSIGLATGTFPQLR